MIRDDDNRMEHINCNVALSEYNSSNKSQLTAICEILKINSIILEYSLNEFNPNLLNNTRAFERAQRIIRTMTRNLQPSQPFES